MACASPLAEPAPSHEVRKSVTVVFCDVTGSTALGELLDPETLRRVMTRYFDTMKIAIERHGGTVEKFIGDAVMAVFGIPHVHEDDALRAVRAAVEMRDGLQDLNKELERDRGVTLASRIGVNTGEVVAGDPAAGQMLVTGDAVNTAARLEQAAAPGEILIGEETYRLTRDAVRAEPAEPIPAKGKDGADPRVSTRGRHGRRRRPPPATRRADRRPRPRAGAAPTSVRAGDDGSLLSSLHGPGAGGSREDEAGRGVRRAGRGRCHRPPWAMPRLRGRHHVLAGRRARGSGGRALDPGCIPRSRHGKLLTVIGPGERSERIADLVAGLLGLSETDTPVEESFWALRRFLEILAAVEPLILLLDDLQWAEPTFLDLVQHVAEWSRDAPILVLAQSRPELRDDAPGWGGGVANATSISLEPLTEAETVQLIADLIGDPGAVGAVSTRVAEAAEGNPLFVEEMVAMLIDDGFLVREDDRWVAVGDLSEVQGSADGPGIDRGTARPAGPAERAVLERARDHRQGVRSRPRSDRSRARSCAARSTRGSGPSSGRT